MGKIPARGPALGRGDLKGHRTEAKRKWRDPSLSGFTSAWRNLTKTPILQRASLLHAMVDIKISNTLMIMSLFRARIGAIAAVAAFLAVALGAFGAHGLEGRISEADLATFETAVRYQMYHALALLLVAALPEAVADRGGRVAGWGFAGGILVFSGSLYLLLLTGQRWLGALTPLGGIAFLAGWAALAWGFFGRGDDA